MSISKLMGLFNSSIVAASDWFVQIFKASNVVNIYLVFIFLLLLMKFVVAPVFGRSHGSDRARKHSEVTTNE